MHVWALLDTLNNVRLAASIESAKGPGRRRITYQLEELDPDQRALAHALGILDAHIHRPNIQDVGVYTSKDR